MLLIAGLILFFGAHLVPTMPSMRAGLAQRFGGTGYRLAFSLVSLLGLLAIVFGYGEARTAGWNAALWTPPTFTKHISFLLMWPAFVLLVATYVPSRIRDAAKHPMLAAIKIWALAHLIANGDLASILLFGTFLAYGVYDRISVKKRAATGPLGDRQGGFLGDLIAVGVGTGLFLLMLKWGHAALIGVSLFG